VKLLSWNLAGRLRRIPQQVEMLARREPDLVGLQEVTRPGLLLLRPLLAADGSCS
jgi:exonuclease III